MKRSVFAAALLGFCLSSCDRDTSIAKDSKESSEAATVAEIQEQRPPAATPVIDPQDFKVAEEEPGNEPEPTIGQRLDHAIDKTADGLETAKEKTEEGLRKAAGATGGALRRTGEAIEKKASGH